MGLIHHHVLYGGSRLVGHDFDLEEAHDLILTILHLQDSIPRVIPVGGHPQGLAVASDHIGGKEVSVAGNGAQVGGLREQIVPSVGAVAQVETVVHPGHHIVEADLQILIPLEDNVLGHRIGVDSRAQLGGGRIAGDGSRVPGLVEVHSDRHQMVHIPVAHLVGCVIKGILAPAKHHAAVLGGQGIVIRNTQIHHPVELALVLAA